MTHCPPPLQRHQQRAASRNENMFQPIFIKRKIYVSTASIVQSENQHKIRHKIRISKFFQTFSSELNTSNDFENNSTTYSPNPHLLTQNKLTSGDTSFSCICPEPQVLLQSTAKTNIWHKFNPTSAKSGRNGQFPGHKKPVLNSIFQGSTYVITSTHSRDMQVCI